MPVNKNDTSFFTESPLIFLRKYGKGTKTVAHGRRLLFQHLIDFGTGRLPANMALKQGRYRVIQTLGKGGMGAVYLAYDIQQRDKLVAIKEMSQATLRDGEELLQAQQRFQREADILQQLHHPHLPHVYDSFDDRNRSYLVMDYIQGKTLAQVLKQAHGSALSVKQVVDYGLQLCDVLTYLHAQTPPVIFRDLKPSNIIVRDDGQLFLIDFGIARFWQQAGDTEIFVSPGYSSPEQYAGQSTPLADIFSLGATLHHCLTGHDPRSNTQAHQWSFRAVDFFNPHVPSALGQYRRSPAQIERCLRFIEQPCQAEQRGDLRPRSSNLPARLCSSSKRAQAASQDLPRFAFADVWYGSACSRAELVRRPGAGPPGGPVRRPGPGRAHASCAVVATRKASREQLVLGSSRLDAPFCGYTADGA